jgi:hypothetical protein
MEPQSWNTHDWFDRPLEIDPREKFTQFICSKCARSFVIDDSGRRYAIHVSAFTIYRLSDEVTERWLAEPCPNQREIADLEANDTGFREWVVYRQAKSS